LLRDWPSAAITAQPIFCRWPLSVRGKIWVSVMLTAIEISMPNTSVPIASRRLPGASRAGKAPRIVHNSATIAATTTAWTMPHSRSCTLAGPKSRSRSASVGFASRTLVNAIPATCARSQSASKTHSTQSSAARLPRSNALPTTAR
jgi:hypothetical protein